MGLIHEIGGTLIILIVIHLVSDWVMQTDAIARRKSDESPWLLVVHSVGYAIIFIPVLTFAFDKSWSLVASSTITLAASHGAIDTYAPIWLWARFVRRPKEMKDDPIRGFTNWTSKPYGMLLSSGIDQLMHVVFLVLISIMIVVAPHDKSLAKTISFVAWGLAIFTAIVSVATILFLWKKMTFVLEDDDDMRPSMPSQHDE